MTRRAMFFVFIALFSLIQVHAQMEEFEFEERIEIEGSGIDEMDTIMPHDDEDLEDIFEESGSGVVEEEEIEEVIDSFNSDEFEEEPEITGPSLTKDTKLMPGFDFDDTVSASVAPEPPVQKEMPEIEDKFPMDGAGGEDELDVDPAMQDDDNDKPAISTANSASFLKSTQFMAALIVGGCVGLLFAVCVIMLIVYRMRKKDEGSYALDEQKKPVSPSGYQSVPGQEYYA